MISFYPAWAHWKPISAHRDKGIKTEIWTVWEGMTISHLLRPMLAKLNNYVKNREGSHSINWIRAIRSLRIRGFPLPYPLGSCFVET